MKNESSNMEESIEKAKLLLRTGLVIDGTINAAFTRDYFVQMRAAGYLAAIVTLAMPFYNPDRVFQTLKDVAEWKELISENSDLVTQVFKARDILEAKKTSRTGIIFGMQDAGPFAHDTDLLYVYHSLGLRVTSLAYNWRNILADGCMEPGNAGLSHTGRSVVRLIGELRILLDLSHVGHRSAMEALELSNGPVVLTHSNPKSVCDSPRNVADELMDMIATKGGVVGVSPLPLMLTRRSSKKERTIDDFFPHLDYVVERIGIDHVGFGSDFYKFNLQDAISRNVAGTFTARLEREPVRSEEDIDPTTKELRHPRGIRGVDEIINPETCVKTMG